MYRREAQSVLRCGQCNKPFDKESTLKRHGYYCRSRKAGRTIRSRSCISCARGKARCDNGRPECSRCVAKATQCSYPADTPKVIGPGVEHSEDALIEQPRLALNSPCIETRLHESNDGNLIDNALFESGTEFAALGAEHLDWGNPEIDFTNLMNAQASDGTVVEYPESSSSIPNQTIQGYQTSSLYVSIPPQPTSALRSLNQRPKIKTGSEHIAKLILHTLKSYPLMMLRDNSLPPYIHPYLISSNTENNQMEPLTNCISLVHMISSRAQGSRKLFWRNVRVECERLYQEYSKWSKWELLAAMQALSIYIIVRLDEGETDYNNFDSLLIRAVILIAQKFSAVEFACHTQSALTNYDIEVGWKDWVFEESRRRLAVVLRIVNMLVYFEPAALCELRTDLIIAPLPAKKQLWEAGNEVLWKSESQKEPAGFQMVFGLDVNGDLVRMDERQLSCSHRMLPPKPSDLARKTTNWEEWCSGMDGFGGLVMLASSMALLV